MKKYLIVVVAVLICGTFSSTAFAAKGFDTDAFNKNVASTFKNRGQGVNVKTEVLKKMDNPQGYYFVKLVFSDPKTGQPVGEQFMFSDGKFIVQDFLSAKNMESLGKELAFDFAPVAQLDLSGLTPSLGKPGAKNVIVEVTDFQCPYCVQANAFLHKVLKDRKDVVVYMMHMPLRQIHPKADILAKVFEAGMMMGKNFANDLYDKANGELTEAQIINKYAKQTSDQATFKKHIASKEVADKVKNSEEQALKLGIRATPAMFINGKLISGFDEGLIMKAMRDFK